ncbi:unnamed protein product, partial [Didymodactylos carnosus]
DSHEFLNLIISIITEEIQAIRKKIEDQTTLTISEQLNLNHHPLDINKIVDPTTTNFQFCIKTERTCTRCNSSTVSIEIHTALLIHVTGDESKSHTDYLENLIQNYFVEEKLDCYCDVCNTTEEKLIHYSIAQLPRVFVLYLKRWHVTKTVLGELESVSKEDQEVHCSLKLNMKPYCTSDVQEPKLFSTNGQLPILKDLLKQRDKIMNDKSTTSMSNDEIDHHHHHCQEQSDDFSEPKRSCLNSHEDVEMEVQINNCNIDSPDSSKTVTYTIDSGSPVVDGSHADYRLFALINHHGGSSDVGHYTSTVYDCQQNVWWSYDDTSVVACTEEKALKDLAPDAYGVMYIHKINFLMAQLTDLTKIDEVSDLNSEFEYSTDKDDKKRKRFDLCEKVTFKSSSVGLVSRQEGQANANKERFHSQFMAMNAYERHKKLVNDYVRYYSKEKSFSEIFKRDKEKRLAKKYYDKLFKEYCICDLSRWKEKKIAMRWRIDREVVSGKGERNCQFICGEKRCTEKDDLRSWEILFGYLEHGRKRDALIKLIGKFTVTYYLCSVKEFVSEKQTIENNDELDHVKRSRTENSTSATVQNKKDEDDQNAAAAADEGEIWSKPIKETKETTREDEFEDYLQTLLF